MTHQDKELINRLKRFATDLGSDLVFTAAYRIEEVVKEIEVLHKEVRLLEIGFDASQAKLTKAVELLEEIEVRLKPISGFFFDTFPRREIKATLAEVKGESHE